MRTLLENSGVAGWDHHAGDLAVNRGMSIGETLILERDPKNEHDENAVKVLYPSEGKNIMVGFVGRASGSGAIALLLDMGQILEAEVAEMDPKAKNPWKRLTINVRATGAVR